MRATLKAICLVKCRGSSESPTEVADRRTTVHSRFPAPDTD